jgi:hypothetical protein
MPPRQILKKVTLLPYTENYGTGNLATNEIIYASGKFIIGAPGSRNYALNHSSFSAVQRFDSSGTWVKPSQGTLAFVIISGAGGGGTCGNSSLAGCGGGAGGITAFIIPLSLLSNTVSVTVGSPGMPTAPGSSSSASSGGSSSFGSYAAAGGQGAPPAGSATGATSGINSTTASRGNTRLAGINSGTIPGLGGINEMASSIGAPQSDGITASGGNGGSGGSLDSTGTTGGRGSVLIMTI